MVDAIKEEVESVEWGVIIAEDGDSKMYRSFKYRGVEYSMFDDVYTLSEGAKETDIGKITRIWRTSKHKKVKILWFFRPRDISNFLKDARPSWKELFLASGKGEGLSNDIPLEAIIGKCNVICTSRDTRNVSRANSDIAKADYFFSHVFDVGTKRLSDRLPDEIASTNVERLLKWEKAKSNANVQRPRAVIPEETRPLKRVKFSDADTVHILEPKVDFSDRAVGDAEVKAVRGTSSERSKMPAYDQQWFVNLPWEEKVEVAHELRRLVTLINLNPSYTSSDVQDMILSAFKLKVEAKILPCRSFSSPSPGQALVIFNSMDDANFVVSELEKKCLVDEDGRPIVAYKTNLIKPPTRKYFPGHTTPELFERKGVSRAFVKPKTVSTSHCAQENTSESQLAAKWISFHHKCDLWCKALHKEQAEERALCLKKLKSRESRGNIESSKATPENETVKWQPKVVARFPEFQS